jgi:hypothetical protein
MPSSDLLALARSVLAKNHPGKWDSAWDRRGTDAEKLSQEVQSLGTAKIAPDQQGKRVVPPSHALGFGTVGHYENHGTALGTDAGQPYGNVLAALRSDCPQLIETDRWQQAIQDADCFLRKWGAQAHALGWTVRELFGLHPVPAHPRPSYHRLSRYDATGLIWLLQGRPVIALTETEAAIQSAGAVVMYRKHNKPAFGPLGDSLDDMELRP